MNKRAALTIPAEVSELEPHALAGVFDTSDLHFAAALSRYIGPKGKDRFNVLFAAAMAARAPRFGHVCLDLANTQDALISDLTDPSALEGLRWPSGPDLVKALSRGYSKILVEQATALDLDDNDMFQRPMVLRGNLLYLQRYERYERRVLTELQKRSGQPSDEIPQLVADTLEALFPEPGLQRDAARLAVSRKFTVLAGGPGTGKTYTLARVLATLRIAAFDQGRDLAVALAAPTGKAASRMTEAINTAVEELDLPPEVRDLLDSDAAVTIHRLLGRADGVRFRHDATDRLHHEVVVVDEASMISLPLMARLLDAIRDEARVILVGDPFQLASVEAGAVFGEIAAGKDSMSSASQRSSVADSIVRLQRTHRFGETSGIGRLADAVKVGSVDQAMTILGDPTYPDVQLIDPANADGLLQLEQEVVRAGSEVIHAASGDDPVVGGNALEAMERAAILKVLCGTRFGSLGVYAWQKRIEKGVLGDRTDRGAKGRWYIGRPVMMTRNDYLLSLFNGDTGVVVAGPGGSRRVHFPGTDNADPLDPAQLGEVDTWWAMTIHKSQGSEFDHVVLSLPDPDSRVLTRELLYTGITRAKEKITMVASEESLNAAIVRPVQRASGLRSALWQ